MDAVYEELEEAKAEIERLKEQYRAKLELSESLKRSHNDQVGKNKEASFKLEKLAQELHEKEGEISTARQVYDVLKSNLVEKESIIKRITSVHDKLRLDCNEKIHKFEEENKVLASALDDSNAKNFEQEQQICALKQEVEGVKRILNCSQKKGSDSDGNKIALSKDLGAREDAFFKLEEEKKKLEDQLKWRKEQFVHLEAAHEKLRKQFKLREKEWEMEKAELLHGISTLETKLDSQTRISQDLQHRLEMCNNALAHAETKRKVLEVQLSESRMNLDNVCAEYDEAKLNFEDLATRRDQEISTLRSSLGTKDILYKEMEYQFRKMEQEKQELLISLKDFQEAQIRESSFSSASKLQNKLKSLEQLHKGCSTNLKAKESEWCSQIEKLSEEVNYFRSEVESKDSSLNELNRELEACDSLIMKLELLNQETSLMLLVLKSELSEHSCMDLKNKQVEENMYELMQALEHKKATLNTVHEDLEEERHKVVILSKKVQILEELQFPLQKEVARLKDMLKDSTSSRLQSEEQMLLIQDDLKKVHEALDRADEELCEKFCEAHELEFELRIWKSVAEQLETNLKQNHQMRIEVEASLLEQTEMELNLKQEKQSLSHQLEVREREIDSLQQQLVEVNESMKATIAESSSSAEGEEDSEGPFLDLHQLLEEKDQRISDLQQLVASLEHEFESSTTSFSSKLSQMQREMNVLRESWEKIKANGVMKEMEIQEKNMAINELENDLRSLAERVDEQDQNLINSEKRIQEIEGELQKKEVKIHSFESKISTSDKTIKSLSSENKTLINKIGTLSEKMEKLNTEDLQLMERLGNIVKSLPGDEEQENINNIFSSSPMKKVEATIYEERSPLRTLIHN